MPKCSKKESIKYFLSESNSSATFLVRLSDFKYDKHLFTFNEDTFRPEHFASFCLNLGINSTSNTLLGTVAVTCQSSLDVQCHESVCIRSCCPPKHVFHSSLRKCVSIKSIKNKGIQGNFKSVRDVKIARKDSTVTHKRKKRKKRIYLHGLPQCDSQRKSSYILQNYSGYESTNPG